MSCARSPSAPTASNSSSAFTWRASARELQALVAIRQGRNDEARRILELNAQQFPSSAGVAVELGRVLEALGERDRAIEQYRRALTIQPNNRPPQERQRALGQP